MIGRQVLIVLDLQDSLLEYLFERTHPWDVLIPRTGPFLYPTDCSVILLTTLRAVKAIIQQGGSNGTIAKYPSLFYGPSAELQAAFDYGAHDYICSPFDYDELVGRLSRLFRKNEEITWGSLSFSIPQATLSGPGGSITLTNAEAKLLRQLFESDKSTVNRTILCRDLVIDSFSKTTSAHMSRKIDITISRLRKKLNAISSSNTRIYIKSLHGYGYQLVEEHI
ncbi:MAG: winged helix-turn-helix domain-containing protein [Termitinemataceae bacterium]